MVSSLVCVLVCSVMYVSLSFCFSYYFLFFSFAFSFFFYFLQEEPFQRPGLWTQATCNIKLKHHYYPYHQHHLHYHHHHHYIPSNSSPPCSLCHIVKNIICVEECDISVKNGDCSVAFMRSFSYVIYYLTAFIDSSEMFISYY